MDNFLHGVGFPTIEPGLASELDQLLQVGKIIEAIKSMQSSKAVGADRFLYDIL